MNACKFTASTRISAKNCSFAGQIKGIYYREATSLLPVEDVLGRHFEEGDEGVDYPVGQPLLVVHLGRALHRAD